jgi:hypothetical protein
MQFVQFRPSLSANDVKGVYRCSSLIKEKKTTEDASNKQHIVYTVLLFLSAKNQNDTSKDQLLETLRIRFYK